MTTSLFPIELFSGPAPEVAPRLLGCVLLLDGVGGRIVEVEAYDQSDPASHTFNGRTARNQSMFGPPGHVYVYRSYGIHWCFNFVCEQAGHGAGVLVRALEPLHGIETMKARRNMQNKHLLCAGPGRLTQALGIEGTHDGLILNSDALMLLERDSEPTTIQSGPRIGITRATEVPWRFGIHESPWLSRPFRP